MAGSVAIIIAREREIVNRIFVRGKYISDLSAFTECLTKYNNSGYITYYLSKPEVTSTITKREELPMESKEVKESYIAFMDELVKQPRSHRKK